MCRPLPIFTRTDTIFPYPTLSRSRAGFARQHPGEAVPGEAVGVSLAGGVAHLGNPREAIRGAGTAPAAALGLGLKAAAGLGASIVRVGDWNSDPDQNLVTAADRKSTRLNYSP